MPTPKPTRPREPRAEVPSRTLPWSARAVILLAFAIQLGSVGDRLTPTAVRPVDCLTLCDGQLLALWLDEAPPGHPVALAAVVRDSVVEADGACPCPGDARPVHVGLDQVGGSILPMPPPAVC